MSRERVSPPSFPYGPELEGDLVEMSAEQLLEHGVKVFEELEAEVDRLHRHLPRKFEDRVRGLRPTRAIVLECMRGAKAKVAISRLSLEEKRR